MFDRVWKEQIVKPKDKVGFWKPKEDIRSVQDKDDDKCCEKARQLYYAFWLTYHKNLDFPSSYLNTINISKKMLFGEHAYLKDCKKLRDHINMHKRTFSTLGSNVWPDKLQEILDAWDRCEKNV